MSKKAIRRKASDSLAAPETPLFVVELNENDVLMGRGSPSAEYSGNLRFRQLVIDRREEYLQCTRRNEKHRIAMDIIDTINKRGGRFLQRITTMEEAERLNVPPRTQAWKVVEKGSALYVKVKQLMRDVGEDTQKKRKIRREEKRKETKQQASVDGDAGGSPKRQKMAPPMRADSSFSPSNTNDDRKPTSTVRFTHLRSNVLQPPEPRNRADHHSESGSSISTGGSTGMNEPQQPPDLAQYASELHPPESNETSQLSSLSLLHQLGLVATDTSTAVPTLAQQNFSLPLLNSLLQQNQQEQTERQEQSQQQPNILSILSLLQGNQAAAQPQPMAPPPSSIEDILLNALTSQQAQLRQQNLAPPPPPTQSEESDNQQPFNNAQLELLALLLNAMQHQQSL
eukprot:scaffold1488_cov141-Amphora_coffeaeformis.AAC.8